MKKSFWMKWISMLVLTAGLSGCATHVTVSSEPSGAEVLARGSGRPSYGWKSRGIAPVTFKAHYNAIQTVARWPDGTVSAPKRTSLVMESNVHVHHEQAEAAPTEAQ